MKEEGEISESDSEPKVHKNVQNIEESSDEEKGWWGQKKSEQKQIGIKKQKLNNTQPKICKWYPNNKCRLGDKCKFQHLNLNKNQEICKYVLTGSCNKGNLCTYSHDLLKVPCKYLHGTGTCNSGNKCRFSHQRLAPDQICSFIQNNWEFLFQYYKENGKTNLGVFFTKFLELKQQQQAALIPQTPQTPQNPYQPELQHEIPRPPPPPNPALTQQQTGLTAKFIEAGIIKSNKVKIPFSIFENEKKQETMVFKDFKPDLSFLEKRQ